MNNVLIVNEDSAFLEGLKLSLKTIGNVTFYYTDSSSNASDYIHSNRVTVACISFGLELMSADELADLILDLYPECKLIFIYNESSIDDAIDVFNSFDNSSLISSNNLSSLDLKSMIEDMLIEYNKEEVLNQQLYAYRDREKSYKKSMSDMTDLLNARVSGYNSVTNIYSKTIDEISRGFHEDIELNPASLYKTVMQEYIQEYLVENVVLSDMIKKLNANYNVPLQSKHFLTDINNIEKAPRNTTFALCMICCIICGFYEKYRIKTELRQANDAFRLDIIVDSRLGGRTIECSEYMMHITSCICNSLCNKVEFGSKDGIYQFRLYFVQK